MLRPAKRSLAAEEESWSSEDALDPQAYAHPLTGMVTTLTGKDLSDAVDDFEVIDRDTWANLKKTKKEYLKEIYFYYYQYINIQTIELETSESPQNLPYIDWLDKSENAEYWIDLRTKLPTFATNVEAKQKVAEFRKKLWDRIEPFRIENGEKYTCTNRALLVNGIIDGTICSHESLKNTGAKKLLLWSDNHGQPLKKVRTFLKNSAPLEPDEEFTHSSETQSLRQ